LLLSGHPSKGDGLVGDFPLSQAEVFGAIRVFRRGRGGGTSRPLGIPCASRNGHLDPKKMRLRQENLVLKTKDFGESLEAKW